MSLLFAIRHFFGMNRGIPETFIKDDRIFTGFRCECGALHSVEESTRYTLGPEDAEHAGKGDGK